MHLSSKGPPEAPRLLCPWQRTGWTYSYKWKQRPFIIKKKGTPENRGSQVVGGKECTQKRCATKPFMVQLHSIYSHSSVTGLSLSMLRLISVAQEGKGVQAHPASCLLSYANLDVTFSSPFVLPQGERSYLRTSHGT